MLRCPPGINKRGTSHNGNSCTKKPASMEANLEHLKLGQLFRIKGSHIRRGLLVRTCVKRTRSSLSSWKPGQETPCVSGMLGLGIMIMYECCGPAATASLQSLLFLNQLTLDNHMHQHSSNLWALFRSSNSEDFSFSSGDLGRSHLQAVWSAPYTKVSAQDGRTDDQ